MLCNYTNPCGDPCCSSCQQPVVQTNTTTTTTTLCPDAILCDNAYALNCLIYNGPDYPCYGVKNGDSALDIIKIILGHFNPTCNPTTTTTSTTSTTTTSTTSTTTTTTAAPGSLVCNRPLGLLTTKLTFGYGSSIFSLSDFRTQSVSGVCSEFQIFKSSAQSSVSLLNSLLGQTTSVAVGNTLYNGNTDRSCTYVPQGNYWYLPSLPITGSSSALIYSSPTIKIVTVGTNGLITNISDCTYIPPTTTSTSTTSTTTTSTSTTSTTSTSTSTTTTTTLAPCNLTVSDFGVVASSTTQSRALFSWTNVGTPITVPTYTLEYKLGSSSTWLPVGVGTYQSAVVTLSGLSAGTLYNARIRANAINSTSCSWVTISFSTLPITTSTTTSTTSTTTTTTIPPVYKYVPYGYRCIKDSSFGIIKTITGLSSPRYVWYDDGATQAGRKRVWVFDLDGGRDFKGNVYWFNPSTTVDETGMTYYSGFKCITAYIGYIDVQYKKIYATGFNLLNNPSPNNGGGLFIFDMESSDSTPVRHKIIEYGTDQMWTRQFLFVTSDSIYVTSAITTGPNAGTIDVYRFNRANVYTSSIIPTPVNVGDNSHFRNGSASQVRTKIWIVAGTGSTSKSTIDVYNSTTLALEASIPIPNIAQVPGPDWCIGCSSPSPSYWQSGYYDVDYNRYYVIDLGGKTIYAFTPNSTDNGVLAGSAFSVNLTILSEDRVYFGGNFSLDPASAVQTVDQKLYLAVEMSNKVGVNLKYKTYQINRNATSASNFFVKIVKDDTYTSSTGAGSIGQTFANLAYVDVLATDGQPYGDSAMGANIGTPRWSGSSSNSWPLGNPNTSSDGSITLLSNKIGNDNTGDKECVSLKKVRRTGTAPNYLYIDEVDSNNNLIVVPISSVSSSDIVGSTADVTDYGTCNPGLTDCPVIRIKIIGDTLYYEISIPTAVKRNINITKIEVFAGTRATGTNSATIVSSIPKITHTKQTGDVFYYSGSFNILGTSANDIVVKYLNDLNVQQGSDCSKIL